MMVSRIVVSSVVRHATLRQTSGFIRVVDVPRRTVLMTSSFPESRYRSDDSNSRGGLRGARGISVFEDRLVLANTEQLFVYDPAWRLIDEISHPLMGGVHDILAETDGIWVTCTTADLLIKIGWNGTLLSVWEWRSDPGLLAAFGFENLPAVDRHLDYRNPETTRSAVRNIIHLNAVTRGPDGLLLSFGRVMSPNTYRKEKRQRLLGRIAKTLEIRRRVKKIIPHRNPAQKGGVIVNQVAGSSHSLVRLHDEGHTERLIHTHPVAVPNHNVLQVDDMLVYNDSNHSFLVGKPLQQGRPERKVSIPGDPSFVRGLAHIGNVHFLVGNQGPASISIVDLAEERLLDTIPLPGPPGESVQYICLLPDHFQEPPASLIDTLANA